MVKIITLANPTPHGSIAIAKLASWSVAGLAFFILVAAMPMTGFAQKKKSTALKPAPVIYKHAYEFGYRAGYEDGFAQGKADVGQPPLADYSQNDLYNRADRTYQDRMGAQIEFQEGYRVAFGLAYTDGYFGRAYNTAVPTNLGRVVVARLNASGVSPSVAQTTSSPGSSTSATGATGANGANGANSANSANNTNNGGFSDSGPGGGGSQGRSAGMDRVPDGIEMKIRLQDRISTKQSKEGDQFTAVVIDPRDFSEARITGHIAKLKKAGGIKGKTELQLAFDTLTLSNGQTLALAAQVVKVYDSDSVHQTDEEGNVQSSDRSKDTILRTGGGGALGAIIGGIAGGGSGAGIGAAIGAGAGIASVYIDGGKQLQLDPGTEILIRTAAPSK